MSHDFSSRNSWFPAPCIIDVGIIIDKQDMQRVLTDLTRVRYIHTQDGRPTNEGEGCVLEVFADPHRATLLANHALYLNVYSFDYIELSQSTEGSVFDLIQEDRRLRLVPLTNPLLDQVNRAINAAELEAMVTEVISARLDVQIDDEEHFPF
ncbi:MAG: hypothetical protein KME43_27375 [Myxacorys chilensis ATA2-1-KO14]|jgi:hypothetical protein|nr:hypothetical protein [Myxacorys chilensis ATA2-1-KO14]